MNLPQKTKDLGCVGDVRVGAHANIKQKELEEVKKRVKIEAAEDHKERRQRKRKRLETATAGDGEVTDERPAKRRLPNVGDEVISLED